MGVLAKLLKPTFKSTEITALLVSNRTNLIGDVLSIDKERGENNTLPRMPSTSGVRGLFDGGSYWTSRTSLNSARVLAGGFGLTANMSIIGGGGYYLSSVERSSNNSNTWNNRATLNVSRGYISGTTLTSDLGCFFNGNNGNYLTTLERYSDTANAWTIRSPSGTAGRFGVSGASLTSDAFLSIGGNNGSGPIVVNYTDQYTDSGNAWSSRAVIPIATYYAQAASMTSDLCYNSGGYNGVALAGNTRFSNGLNSWVTRTSLYQSMYYIASASMTSDLFLSYGGYNDAARLGDSRRFSDSSNTWTNKSGASLRYAPVGASFNSSQSLFASGDNGATSGLTERYTDNEVSLRSGKSFFSNQINDTPAVTNSDDAQHVYTTTLATTNLNTFFVRVLEEKLDSTTPATTVDISPDGGTTWSLSEQAVNSQINISSLNVSDLRLRFNLKRSTGANIWTSKLALPTALFYPANSMLGVGQALSMGGGNSGATNNFGLTFKATNAGGAWSSRTAYTASRQGPGGGSLSSDLALCAGGYNAGVGVNNTDRFSDNSNSWVARTVKTSASGWLAPFTLTSDRVVMAGGYTNTQVNSVYRYSDSANNWTSVQSIPTNNEDFPGAALTTDLGMVFGGYATFQTKTYRYSDSGQSWTQRVSLPLYNLDAGSSEVNSDLILVFGGNNNNVNLKYSWRYMDSGNALATRSDMPSIRSAMAYPSMGNGQAMSAGGTNGVAINNTDVYNDGESYFKGFAIK